MPGSGLAMVFGWALLGIIAGAAGTEFLRKKKPELIKKMERAAKGLVDSLNSSGPGSAEAKESTDEEAQDT